MSKLTLINPNIHHDAKLKKDKFLDRIKNVQQIRANSLERNFFPNELKEWEILEELHKAINNGVFNFGVSGYKIFSFEIDEDLYNWFKNNDLDVIRKQVVNWIAAVYLSRPSLQEYFDNYIFAPVLTEVKSVIKNHYSENYFEKYKILSKVVELFEAAFDGHNNELKYEAYSTFQEKHSKEIENLYAERDSEYTRASSSYINCSPPKHLRNPISENNVLGFYQNRLRYSPHINIRIAYFTETDWIFIVERDINKANQLYKSEQKKGIYSFTDIKKMMTDSEKDTLERAESDKTMWNNWLYSYKNYEKTKSYIFSLYGETSNTGLIYIIRQRNTNFFKIGWTEEKIGMTKKQSVEKRISSLQTGNPYPLDIVDYFSASSRKTEKTLHLYFDSKRKTGEWFELSDKDLQNIINDDWRINKNIF